MTIPISQVVSMQPGVIGAGGAQSKLSGMGISQDGSIPPGTILSFYNAPAVSAWFGVSAPETTLANNYFPGIVNGGQTPYVLKFARNAAAAAPAGSYGAQLGLTLSQLQALSGTLIVTTSSTFTSANINLATATDFNSAAALMQAAFTSPNFSVTWDAQRGRFLLLTTATGASATCSDVSGTLAANVGLNVASGAFNQPTGVAQDVPATCMNRVVSMDTNWGAFATTYAAVIADRQAYGVWNGGQNYGYVYASWDTDAASSISNNAASFGALAFSTPYQGVWPLYGGVDLAGGALGYIASVNFQVANGRTDAAFRQLNSGLTPLVSSLTMANALLSNNYTYLGAYANAANTYSILYDGKCSGAFKWIDTYIDQIYLNRELQRTFFETLLAYNSVPYNTDGYTAIYRAGVDVAEAAVTSGIIRAGVTLSQSQQQQVNSQAGRNISDTLQTRGWYLLIGDPASVAVARSNRTSPNAQFWYTDGGSIHNLNVPSKALI
ncbi:hypothetical protein PQ43W_42 [Ralstonia phage PQ43W]